MKILNICMNAPFTEHYSYQDNLLTEYQKKLGHDVIIITSTRTRDKQGKICKTEPCDKILYNGVRLIRLEVNGRLKSILGIYPEIYKILQKIKPDFIYIHGLCSFVPQTVIKYKKKNKEVNIVADNHQDSRTTNITGLFAIQQGVYRYMWRNWIKNVEKVYGTTSWRTTFANRIYGIPKEKLDTLVMGIDTDNLPKNKAEVRKQIRKELNIGEDIFLFVTGGKLDKRKNTIELMRAFTRISDEKAALLIFGSVAEEIREEFEKLCADDSRIRYIGYIKSEIVNRYFLASDFGAFPGRHSVLWEEAIGCGLPCLFPRYEERDHTEVCDNAVVIENPSENDIYNCMNRVLNTPQYYTSIKANAEKAAKVFSYYEIAKKSLECAE